MLNYSYLIVSAFSNAETGFFIKSRGHYNLIVMPPWAKASGMKYLLNKIKLLPSPNSAKTPNLFVGKYLMPQVASKLRGGGKS